MDEVIGRSREKKELHRLIDSREAEFLAVFGRRRVGKTFLIRQFFADQICFELTGQLRGNRQEQLLNFTGALLEAGATDVTTPKTWQEAFFQLINFLKKLPNPPEGEKLVIFFDEVPWLASRKSRFLLALDHFWNSWASRYPHIILVICGSATSWMIEKILHDRGGLHNRVTKRLRLEPFSLGETEQFLQQRGIRFSKEQILQLTMVMGGIPHYLKEIEASESLSQNIERIAFSQDGLLREEFNQLYEALFEKPERHIEVVERLATKRSGMVRNEILKTLKGSDGGRFSKVVKELTESGFIKEAKVYGKRQSIYYLADEYSIFYLKWLAKLGNQNTRGLWENLQKEASWTAWTGFAFETICFKHIEPIKRALGISGIYTQESSWRHISDTKGKGAQIDLVIQRRDQCTHLVEIKFANQPFTISKSYAENLRNKIAVFRAETKTDDVLYPTFISTHGVSKNSYALEIVTHSIEAEALFIAPDSEKDDSLM